MGNESQDYKQIARSFRSSFLSKTLGDIHDALSNAYLFRTDDPDALIQVNPHLRTQVNVAEENLKAISTIYEDGLKNSLMSVVKDANDFFRTEESQALVDLVQEGPHDKNIRLFIDQVTRKLNTLRRSL